MCMVDQHIIVSVYSALRIQVQAIVIATYIHLVTTLDFLLVLMVAPASRDRHWPDNSWLKDQYIQCVDSSLTTHTCVMIMQLALLLPV